MSDVPAPHVIAVDLALAMTRLRSRLRTEQADVTTAQTMSQLSILGRIAEREPVTASELAQAEHVRQQSISETISGLRKQGLVEGHPDPDDGRKTLLRLTDDGRKLVDSILESRGVWLARAIEHEADESERKVLVRAVEILSRLAACDLGSPSAEGWRL